MASRSLDDLEPAFAEKVRELVRRAEVSGLDLLIYCTLRSHEEQARLFRQSRSLLDIRIAAEELRHDYERPDLADILMGVGPQFGPHVTNAAPGMSIHQYGLAVDGVPMRGGKPVWGTENEENRELWMLYGQIAVELGLEWAGNWTIFTEFPHVQDANADWEELIRNAQQ